MGNENCKQVVSKGFFVVVLFEEGYNEIVWREKK